MTIEMPVSLLDLNTRVISTHDGVLIKRSDFEITGKNMEFNTETKQGRLIGPVKMTIFNMSEEAGIKPEAKSGE
jgi:lipopolysaccharide export system protein LptC